MRQMLRLLSLALLCTSASADQTVGVFSYSCTQTAHADLRCTFDRESTGCGPFIFSSIDGGWVCRGQRCMDYCPPGINCTYSRCCNAAIIVDDACTVVKSNPFVDYYRGTECFFLAAASQVPGSTAREWQNTISVVVVDGSSTGSPVRITGSVVFNDNMLETRRRSQRNPSITATNLSDKKIIALVSELKAWDFRDLPTAVVGQYDKFFERDAFASGDSVILLGPPPGGNGVIEDQLIRTPQVEPRAEAKVLWVQFSDGSTWGDNAAASQVILARRSEYKAMKLLVDAYNERGEDGFRDALVTLEHDQELVSNVHALKKLGNQKLEDVMIRLNFALMMAAQHASLLTE